MQRVSSLHQHIIRVRHQIDIDPVRIAVPRKPSLKTSLHIPQNHVAERIRRPQRLRLIHLLRIHNPADIIHIRSRAEP